MSKYAVNIKDSKVEFKYKCPYDSDLGNFIHDRGGNFGLSRYETFYCREVFGDSFTRKLNHFFFHMKKAGDIKKIAKFIAFIEGKLKLKKDQRVLFETTSIQDTVKINVPYWWRANGLRRQLLTALLRTGTYYGTTSKKLNQSPYFRSPPLQKALRKFSNGYTRTKIFIGQDSGWVDNFDRLGSDKALVKPVKSRTKKSLVHP